MRLRLHALPFVCDPQVDPITWLTQRRPYLLQNIDQVALRLSCQAPRESTALRNSGTFGCFDFGQFHVLDASLEPEMSAELRGSLATAPAARLWFLRPKCSNPAGPMPLTAAVGQPRCRWTRSHSTLTHVMVSTAMPAGGLVEPRFCADVDSKAMGSTFSSTSICTRCLVPSPLTARLNRTFLELLACCRFSRSCQNVRSRA